MLGANYAPFQGSLRVASGCLPVGYHMASGWPRGAAWDAVRPVPPKTAKSGPQPPKSAIESHLRFAESFRVHGPISTSEFAAVSTPPPRNNSLRYSRGEEPLPPPFSAFLSESLRLCVNSSQPARRLEYSSTKSPPFPPPRPRPARPKPEPRHRPTPPRPRMGQTPAKSTWRLNAASSSRSELPREAFGEF